jgi:chemotaxis signal transduction protein
MEHQFVVFTLAGESLGWQLRWWSVSSRCDHCRVPFAPDFIQGVISLYGRVLPVMDLRNASAFWSKRRRGIRAW